MSKCVLSQLDDILRILESQQKRFQQHPEIYRHYVVNIEISEDLLRLTDFYVYFIPFCFQLHLSIYLREFSIGEINNDNIADRNIKNIEKLGIQVIYSELRTNK